MWLYRWFLRLCPAALRREYGDAMEDMFARRVGDARAAGVWRIAHMWCRELTSVLALAASERWGAAARDRRRRHPDVRRKVGRMDLMGQEVRHAARRLMRSPAFTLAAVATLALAIGANASIFAVVQGVVLNPLPYPDSDRLIELDHGSVRLRMPAGMGSTAGLYFHYAERSRALDSIALYRTIERTLTGDGDPARIRVTRVTPSLSSVLRVSPALGRWFTDKEGVPGASPVVVLSHGLWLRRYGRDPGVVGRAVALDGVATEIVGVMPASYAFPDARVDMWIPLPMARAMGFGLWNYNGVARLRSGVTLDAARTELNGLIGICRPRFPAIRSRWATWKPRSCSRAGPSRKQRLAASHGHCGSCSHRSASYCWSRARTSPTCFWCAPRHGSVKWPFAGRSAQAPAASRGSS